jgi:rhamnosyltransferase
MKVIAGIVSYNPKVEKLKDKINLILEQCEELVIVDNGSKNADELRKSISLNNRITVKYNNENLGIAKALNQIFEYAIKKNYAWVLTLDQDTIIPNDLIRNFESISKQVSKIGIVCPRVYDECSKIFIQGNDKNQKRLSTCITSGALTSAEAWKNIGGFDENFFIDEVDNDFCYRISKNGYSILLDPKTIIHHNLGDAKLVTIFGKKTLVYNHNAFRKYYIVRNGIYIDRKRNGHVTFWSVEHTFNCLLKIAFFETDKIHKYKRCIKGIKDGLSDKNI